MVYGSKRSPLSAMALVIAASMFCGIQSIDYTHDQLQYQSLSTKSGAYNFGYDTGLFGAHSFHQQWRDEDGEVRGRFGYTDPNGDLRITHYRAGRDGYRILQNKVEPGNPVRAGPRPLPGSGDALKVPGEDVISRRLSAAVAATPVANAETDSEPIMNYRNALIAYPNGNRNEYVVNKSRYNVPIRLAGEVGRPSVFHRPLSNQLSKFDYYDQKPHPSAASVRLSFVDNGRRVVYYKDGQPLAYDPFEVYAQRTNLGYNRFAAR